MVFSSCLLCTNVQYTYFVHLPPYNIQFAVLNICNVQCCAMYWVDYCTLYVQYNTRKNFTKKDRF